MKSSMMATAIQIHTSPGRVRLFTMTGYDWSERYPLITAAAAKLILHPERESKGALLLERIRAEIGSLTFSAQYQQQPVPLEGTLIGRAWFQYYDQLPQEPHRRIVQSWDVAMTTGNANDYSVGTTWCMVKDDYYLVDVFRGRLKYPGH